MTDELDITAAEQDRAVLLLEQLVRYVKREGGHMAHVDQALLRDVEGFTAECRTRKTAR